MKIYVKPKMTDVGRGQEPVRLTYKDAAGQRRKLPKEGALVDKTPFWVRRRNEGAVEFTDAPKAAKAKAPSKPRGKAAKED